MSRNGSGSYSVPNSFVAGTTITAADHNENWSDIAAEITNSLALDGQSTMSGQLKLANGTAVAPGLAFGADLDTGVYRHGADELGFATAGVAVGYFDVAKKFWMLGAADVAGDASVAGNFSLTGTLAVTGAQTFTGATALNGHATLAKNLILKDGGDTASATTLTLPDGNVHSITGTTATTSIATKGVGAIVWLRATGAWPITHHATNLILLSGVSITCAAGDMMAFEEYATGQWRMIAFHRASGLPLVTSPGIWKLISTATPSSAASVTLTGLDATLYRNYKIVIDHLVPATDAVDLYVRTSTDGGSSYDSGVGAYRWAGHGVNSAATFSSSISAAEINTTFTNTIGNSANEYVSGEIEIINPGAAAFCVLLWRLYALNTSTGPMYLTGGAERIAAADVDAIKLMFSAGNVASGTVKLYGLTI